MAIRKIRTDEDPILRKKSKIVTNYNDRLKVTIGKKIMAKAKSQWDFIW